MPVRVTDTPRPKSPREILGERYAPRTGRSLLAVTGTATAALGAADAVYDWFVRLGFPILSGPVRLQMSDAAPVGMPQFLRAYEQITGAAALREAINIDPAFVPDLRKKHGALLSIAGGAEAFLQLAEDGELLVLDRTRRVIDALLVSADAIAGDDKQEAGRRLQAARFSAFVRGYRARPAAALTARRDRAARRIARAEDRRAALLKEQSLTAARRELLGAEPGEQPPILPAPRPAPRRRASGAANTAESDAALLGGAPLDRCLEAPAADYPACGKDLGDRAAALGVPLLTDEDRAALGGADALVEGDLAVLLADLLPGLPWLTAEGAADLLQLADLQSALVRLQAALALLAQGARDGALVCGRLVLIVHEGTGEWLKTRGPADAEARRIASLRDGAFDLLERSRAELAGPAAAADRTIADIAAETEAQLAAADYARTVSDLASDKDVPEDRTLSALDYKRRIESAAPAAAARKAARRSRPR